MTLRVVMLALMMAQNVPMSKVGCATCGTYVRPVDVPAIQVETTHCFAKYEGCFVRDESGKDISADDWWRRNYTGTAHFWVWSCKDTSRILLTAEDGSKHCIKFGGNQ